MKKMTWLECMQGTADLLMRMQAVDPSAIDLRVEEYRIEVIACRDYLADAPPSFTSQLELERRAWRAEAEVAELRRLLGLVTAELEAVPGLGARERELLAEARRHV